MMTINARVRLFIVALCLSLLLPLHSLAAQTDNAPPWLIDQATVASLPQSSAPGANGFAILGVSAGLLLFFGALMLWTAQLKRRQLRAQEDRIPELMAATERCRGTLRPFAGFVQGQTEQLVDQIDRSLSELLLALDSLRNRASERQVSLLHLSRSDALHDELKAMLDHSSSEIDRIGQQIAELATVDKQIRTKTDKLGSRVDLLSARLERIQAETGYPLSELASELEQLGSALAAADQLEVFDPLAAGHAALETRQAAERLEAQLAAIRLYQDKLGNYAQAATEALRDIERLTTEHGIQTAVNRLQPQSLPDQSQTIADQLEEHLRQGRMNEVARLDEAAHHLLTATVDNVRLLGQLKHQNARDLDDLERKSKRIAETEAELTAGFEALQDIFHEALWQPLQQQFRGHCMELLRISEDVAEVRQQTNEEQQQYEQAHNRLAGWLGTAREAEHTVNACRKLFDELSQRLERSRRIHGGLEQQLRDLQQVISSEHLIVLPAWDEAFSEIRQSYTNVTEWLQRSPYPLDRMEEELTYCAGEIHLVRHQIERKLAEKREAERLLHAAHTYYDRFPHHGFASRFHPIHTRAHQLYTQGNYEESIAHLRHADPLIREMLGYDPLPPMLHESHRGGGGGSGGDVNGSGGAGSGHGPA